MPKAPGSHRLPRLTTTHATTHRAPENRDAAHKRGYDKRWERFRKAFLMEHPLCEYCLADGDTTPATVCDHDLPHHGDPHDFWCNTFTALCARHHNGAKRRAEARYSGEALIRWVEARKTKKATTGPHSG